MNEARNLTCGTTYEHKVRVIDSADGAEDDPERYAIYIDDVLVKAVKANPGDGDKLTLETELGPFEFAAQPERGATPPPTFNGTKIRPFA